MIKKTILCFILLALAACSPKSDQNTKSAPRAAPETAEQAPTTKESEALPMSLQELNQQPIIRFYLEHGILIQVKGAPHGLEKLPRAQQTYVLKNLEDFSKTPSFGDLQQILARTLSEAQILESLKTQLKDEKNEKKAQDLKDQASELEAAMRSRASAAPLVLKLQFGSTYSLATYSDSATPGNILAFTWQVVSNASALEWTQALTSFRDIRRAVDTVQSWPGDRTLFVKAEELSFQDLQNLREGVISARNWMQENPQIQTINTSSSFSFRPNPYGPNQVVTLPLIEGARNHAQYKQVVNDRMKRVQDLGLQVYLYGDLGVQSELDTAMNRLLEMKGEIIDFARKHGVQAISVNSSSSGEWEAVARTVSDGSDFTVRADASKAAIREAMRQHDLLVQIARSVGAYPEFKASPAMRSIFDRANIVDALIEESAAIRDGAFGFGYVLVSEEIEGVLTDCCTPVRLMIHPKSTAADIHAELFLPSGEPKQLEPGMSRSCQEYDNQLKKFGPCKFVRDQGNTPNTPNEEREPSSPNDPDPGRGNESP